MNSLRERIHIGDGSAAGFVARPVALVILLAVLFAFASPLIGGSVKERITPAKRGRRGGRRAGLTADGSMSAPETPAKRLARSAGGPAAQPPAIVPRAAAAPPW